MKANSLSQFRTLLRPLDQQVEILRSLNKSMSSNIRIPESWLDNIDATSDHIQTLEDLEFVFVVPTGLIEQTIRYQIDLLRFAQFKVDCSPDFEEKINEACLDETADWATYTKPGVYVRRINLIAYWRKDARHSSSVNLVRKKASRQGSFLAGLAAIGAYALQDPKLYNSQDGVNLPYLDMPEIRVGDDGTSILFSIIFFGDTIYFSSCSAEDIENDWAQPVFVKE